MSNRNMKQLLESIDTIVSEDVGKVEQVKRSLLYVKGVVENMEKHSGITPEDLDELSDTINEFCDWWNNV